MAALTITQQGAVLTLTLSRPEVRNAFNDEVIADIRTRREGCEGVQALFAKAQAVLADELLNF